MANLIPCANCGHQVSTNAEFCPKCNEENYRGTKCYFCYERSPKQDLYRLPGMWITKVSKNDRNNEIPLSKYAHEECIDEYLFPDNLRENISCITCGSKYSNDKIKPQRGTGSLGYNSISTKYGEKIYSFPPCDNCGENDPLLDQFEVCGLCDLPIFPSVHEKKTSYYRKDGGYIKHHSFCKERFPDNRFEPEEEEKKAISKSKKIFWELLLILLLVFIIYMIF